ncbi:hypothetical protein [Chryseobacterium jejuense]|uniref:Lipoprotein n=1 Tax=Chryseobacterium jejuense TaxID=445960 RepID=A0A2X2VNU5_CHRJE|nr:hypothetical protein [Chryseobacterium jejuense]SDJ20990.1 hypothetical protein SAMN05421542_3027 [Chryseobacterium jejuense]SQB28537.1 Uncharacterised protein [Chryseobacterium jejuense]
MKQLTLVLTFLYSIILISCQDSKKDLSFIKEIKIPYTIEIQDYDKFVEESFAKKDIYEYAKVSNIIGKQDNISKIYFIGKFTMNKQDFVLYQDVTPNESSEFFPAIYITKIGKQAKKLCLTPTTEESYIEKIFINDKNIIIRENYWSSNEKRRKNDKLKEYNFDFSETNSNQDIKSNPSTEVNDLMIKNISTPEKVTDYLIFTKDKNNKLNISAEILNYIQKNTTATENRYTIALERYVSNEITKFFDEKKSVWTEEELIKIIAFASNTTDPLHKKYWKESPENWHNGMWGNILSYCYLVYPKNLWPNLQKQFKKENYYNLPYLKEMTSYATEFDRFGPP